MGMETDKKSTSQSEPMSHAEFLNICKRLLDEAGKTTPQKRPPSLVLHVNESKSKLPVHEATCIVRRPANNPREKQRYFLRAISWLKRFVCLSER